MKEALSIILIAHNEEKNIGSMIEGLLKHYSKEIMEILVVDDASTDETAAIAESWQRRNLKVKLILRTPPCGVGRALRTGFSHVHPQAKYILTMDSDFTKNIEQVSSLLEVIEKSDCDGVIGSRFIPGSILINYPLLKKLMNRLFHALVRRIFHIQQHDLTNNFKLYKVEIIKGMPWRSNDFALNAETGIFPIIAGYNVKEFPVVWAGRSQDMGKTKFSIFKFGGSYIRVIFYSWILLRQKRKISLKL
ncbi:MAG: glycosyltransferase family 2 protein [Candidatus Omnitrophica bacterium]|nr:glycosyltransferase family 2 protein [Candidatus Omnitrophota bacterium]